MLIARVGNECGALENLYFHLSSLGYKSGIFIGLASTNLAFVEAVDWCGMLKVDS